MLGIGLRVAGRVATQRIRASAEAAASAPRVGAPAGQAAAEAAMRGRTAGKAAGGLAQGVSGFLRPFRRVGSILWLEVMGVFFLLPVAVFGPTLWRIRASWAHGPDHTEFLVTAAVIVIFTYLSATSFWRARRR